MLFEFRRVSEISEDEFASLVDNAEVERQDLEFKSKLHLKDPDKKVETKNKREILLDIASMANGGGGYIIIGIEEKNHCACGFSPLSQKEVMGLEEKLRALSQDHISERISRLEIVPREVKGNNLVVIRIPKSSMVPHMVTIEDSSDFAIRHGNDKRQMTIGEVRSAFNEDYVAGMLRRLNQDVANLKDTVNNLDFKFRRSKKSSPRKQSNDLLYLQLESSEQTDFIDEEPIPELLAIEDGTEFNSITNQLVKKRLTDKSYFFMSVTPMDLDARAVNLSDKSFKELLAYPPKCRSSGWNMDFPTRSVKLKSGKLIRGDRQTSAVVLWTNGHLEFSTLVDMSYCWPQSEEEFNQKPVLNPYAVCEFPTTFLYLYKAICELAELSGKFLVSLHYRNVGGFTLYPDSPLSHFYQFPSDQVSPFDGKNIFVPNLTVNDTNKPDSIAYKLLKEVYSNFGLSEEDIPFFDETAEKFSF